MNYLISSINDKYLGSTQDWVYPASTCVGVSTEPTTYSDEHLYTARIIKLPPNMPPYLSSYLVSTKSNLESISAKVAVKKHPAWPSYTVPYLEQNVALVPSICMEATSYPM